MPLASFIRYEYLIRAKWLVAHRNVAAKHIAAARVDLEPRDVEAVRRVDSAHAVDGRRRVRQVLVEGEVLAVADAVITIIFAMDAIYYHVSTITTVQCVQPRSAKHCL